MSPHPILVRRRGGVGYLDDAGGDIIEEPGDFSGGAEAVEADVRPAGVVLPGLELTSAASGGGEGEVDEGVARPDFEVRPEVIHYNPVTRAGAILNLDHATYADIEQMGLADIPVLTSNLLIEMVLPPDHAFAPFSFSEAATTVFPVRLPIADKADVQVQPGERVERGALLAAHSEKLREITLSEAELETARKLRYEQSATFARRDQELAQEIAAVQTEAAGLETRQDAYARSLGFEQEVAELRVVIEAKRAKQESLKGERQQLRSQDMADRLRYEQQVAELLAKKDGLEATVFTRTEFAAEVVNIEFAQNICTLYLRRWQTEDSLKGPDHGSPQGSPTGPRVAVH